MQQKLLVHERLFRGWWKIGFRSKLLSSFRQVLKRLQTDYIDLYQLHWPERNVNNFGRLSYVHKENGDWNQFEDVLGELNKFVDKGKIRYVGLSNETPWGVMKLS